MPKPNVEEERMIIFAMSVVIVAIKAVAFEGTQ